MAVLVQGSVARTLVRMAVPMLAGTFAMNAYNLTDTYFVSRLGTLALAAMGYTFPVVMLLTCIARGLGSGVTTLVAHAVGRHDDEAAQRLVTHGLLLGLVVTVVASAAGYVYLTPLFEALGADGQTLPLIGDYMRPWFAGAIFMTLPMVGSGFLLAVGDSVAASWIMLVGTGANIVLDPIMIFGLLGCPAMGMRGAALATVLAQAISTLWLLHLLRGRHGLLAWRPWRRADYLLSLRQIAGYAVPSILSMILMPLSATVITRILSEFGHEAVAAAGAANRVEMFAFVIPMALGISLTPFVSQNVGAGRLDRVRQARSQSTAFALGYGALSTVLFIAAAPWMAAVVTDDARVAAIFVSDVRIVSVGYGMMEVHRYSGFFLTGLGRPVAATALNGLRVLVFLIPLSYLGGLWWGLDGVFWGRLATDIIVGVVSLTWLALTFPADEGLYC